MQLEVNNMHGQGICPLDSKLTPNYLPDSM